MPIEMLNRKPAPMLKAARAKGLKIITKEDLL